MTDKLKSKLQNKFKSKMVPVRSNAVAVKQKRAILANKLPQNKAIKSDISNKGLKYQRINKQNANKFKQTERCLKLERIIDEKKAFNPASSLFQVMHYMIDDDYNGQRIDNYLFRLFKGVPKSHLYRILRAGEVRVNKKKIDAHYRLKTGDNLRIPPLRLSQTSSKLSLKYAQNGALYADSIQRDSASSNLISKNKPGASASHLRHYSAPIFPYGILYEDDYLLVIDKPAGTAVHGGSGISLGVIERLRQYNEKKYGRETFLELAHRLDRDTSGILLLAKKRSALLLIHQYLRENRLTKRYFACVSGNCFAQTKRLDINFPLHKFLTRDGERRVMVNADYGQTARTIFHLSELLGAFTLVEAELKTGRTHQIRVHLAHLGTPIIGDDKYGDFALNKQLLRASPQPIVVDNNVLSNTIKFPRMFLHASFLQLPHPVTHETLTIKAPMPAICESFLESLRHAVREGT